MQPWQEHGSLGVDLFFSISGLLITHRLLEEHEKNGDISLRAFYIRRGFRIFPPAALYLMTISILSWLKIIETSWIRIAAAALFFRNYYVRPDPSDWFSGHFWSLSVEEHFYLIWPFLLLLMGIPRARKFTPWIALAVAGWRTLDSHLHLVSAASLRYLLIRTDYRIDGLLWGCVAALLLHQPRWRQRLQKVPASWPVVAIPIIVALSVYRPPQCMVAMAVLFPTIILSTLLHPESWIARTLEVRPMRFLGTISYGLYLWQQLFLIRDRQPVFGVLQVFPLNIVVAIGIAWVSYRFLEEPLRQVGRLVVRKMGKNPRPKIAVVAATQKLDATVQPLWTSNDVRTPTCL
jgi:peptidoglycan/LPS O-acetylase OafA/YrhL